MDYKLIGAIIIIMVGLMVAGAALRMDFGNTAAELEKACATAQVDPSYCK